MTSPALPPGPPVGLFVNECFFEVLLLCHSCVFGNDGDGDDDPVDDDDMINSMILMVVVGLIIVDLKMMTGLIVMVGLVDYDLGLNPITVPTA